ncbi:asparaginase [Candidatus Woesearchaeota archaeon]|nr:asparaginase [Candidatus Woesearchaeota archaeon]
MKKMETTTKKPKICILFCGGTIVMAKDPKTGSLDMSGGINEILNLEPKLKEIVEMNVEFIDNIDSTNTKEHHWDTMVKKITEKYNDYDGFVITHGTNTMGYTQALYHLLCKG